MNQLTWQQAEEDLKHQIEDFVSELFDGYEPGAVRDQKVIQDALGGSNRFEQYEIAIIDTPVVQRLRRISQTGLSDQVYPSANATRFEHSLGVCVTARDLIGAINRAQADQLSEEDERAVRTAALLHDCGHGPFSHASEEAFRQMPTMRALLDDRASPYVECGCKPHEILSALIVKSTPMVSFLTETLPDKCGGMAISPEKVAAMILQKPDKDARAYIYQVINGPFDADKLDYIRRDSHATGLQMALEIQRFLYTLEPGDNNDPKKNQRVILVSTGGVHCLEQILFNKMLLTSALYHHHKVRAAECVLRGVFDQTRLTDGATISGRTLRSPVDFLYLTDYDVLARQSGNGLVQRALARVRRRELPKRALVITAETATGTDKVDYLEFVGRMEDASSQDEVKAAILDAMRQAGLCCEDAETQVWVDVPRPVSFSEPTQTYILRENDEVIQLDDLFSLENWLEAYRHFFWKAHVFAPNRVREDVGTIARNVLASSCYKLRLSNLSQDLCKYD